MSEFPTMADVVKLLGGARVVADHLGVGETAIRGMVARCHRYRAVPEKRAIPGKFVEPLRELAGMNHEAVLVGIEAFKPREKVLSVQINVKPAIAVLGGTARLAHEMGVSKAAVRKWVQTNKIPAVHRERFLALMRSRGVATEAA